jgi:2-C-methyl-D-erythritol 2,4-cyclodiphosphate synthase
VSVPFRVGQGFDAHRFSDSPRVLRLGGVEVAGRGLAGHSDADVVAHAVADALLGGAGLDDLGTIFPASDSAWADANSIELLREVVARVSASGWTVGNVDTVVVAQGPKLAPYRAAMQQRLSTVVGAPVSVKPKHPEGLGALGREEGIACWATALLVASAEPLTGES